MSDINRIEGYLQQPSPEDILDLDYLLFYKRFQAFIKNISNKVADLDSETMNLIKAIMTKDVLQRTNRQLGDKLSELMDKSDELIESPNSNSPEIMAQRKKVKEEIDIVMKMQDELRPHLAGIDYMSEIISMSTPEKISQAKKFIEETQKESDFMFNPNQGLN
jgi:oligoendopeptidase F